MKSITKKSRREKRPQKNSSNKNNRQRVERDPRQASKRRSHGSEQRFGTNVGSEAQSHASFGGEPLNPRLARSHLLGSRWPLWRPRGDTDNDRINQQHRSRDPRHCFEKNAHHPERGHTQKQLLYTPVRRPDCIFPNSRTKCPRWKLESQK